ncbi:MAG TPA: hypothetical protein VKB12_15540 [Pyrinomonadaceae bacterium]|nr:hypothetical protein [Pyrinomonadaceae bacterium]
MTKTIRTPHLIFLLLLLTVAVSRCAFFDPDFWFHLETGRIILEQKTIPHADVLSFTNPGREWVTHEWLSEAVTFLTYRAGGYGALAILFGLLVTLSYAVALARSGGATLTTIGATALGALAGLPTWGVRLQVFTLLLSSVYLYVLLERKTKLYPWLVPVMALWANLHAGFAVGLIFVALGVAGSLLDKTPDWRPLSLTLAGCAAAVLLTPHGTRLYTYPLETMSSAPLHSYMTEWQSPNFQSPLFLPFAMLLLLTFTVMAVSPQRAKLSELLFLCALTLASLRSGRHIPLMSLVAIPVLARHSALWLGLKEGAGGRKKLFDVALVCAAGVLALTACARADALMRASESVYPVAAVDFIERERVPLRLFNLYGWGGYLIRRGHQSFVDGRNDMHGDAFVMQYIRVYEGREDYHAMFERYGIEAALVEPHSAIASVLRNDPAWRVAYEDKAAVVFTR